MARPGSYRFVEGGVVVERIDDYADDAYERAVEDEIAERDSEQQQESSDGKS